jgi:hypothetical protein
MQIDASDLSRKIIQSLEDYLELIKSHNAMTMMVEQKGFQKDSRL